MLPNTSNVYENKRTPEHLDGADALWTRLKDIVQRYRSGEIPADDILLRELDVAIGQTLPAMHDDARAFYQRELLERVSLRRQR